MTGHEKAVCRRVRIAQKIQATLRVRGGLRCEASGGGRVGQRSIEGARGLLGDVRTSFGGRSRCPLGKREIGCGGAISLSRRWLPRDALVEFGLGYGLAEEVPVRHRLGSVVPGGWALGGCDQRWLSGLTDVGKDVRNGSAQSCACPLPVSLRPSPFSNPMSHPGSIRPFRIVTASVRNASVAVSRGAGPERQLPASSSLSRREFPDPRSQRSSRG
jgi:hypothetical protein